MAKPIELGLCLEGKDAREFWENEKRTPSEEQIKMFKDAKVMFGRIRF
ncbi:hypothetical protein [Methanococcoides sp. NM1]|nr:hypothetical protein [Methanococcoides sp. NM1]